jgi:prepilin-type N-terminal cleavage/methylation domain-containing protein
MKQRGFTLIEIAVGLAIIALLLGMMMVPLGTQFDQQRMSDTQRQLNIVTEALTGFAVANGRVPCPATANVANTTANAGTEARTVAGTVTSCSLSEGVVPWATLGINETDAWGRRFTYRVTSAWADFDSAAGTLSSFTLTDDGTLTVTNGSANIATTLVAVVVSHGKNGAGAYQTDGTRLTLGTGDELENADGDNTFVSRTNAPDFDDLLAWLSPAVLKARMVASSRLP